MTLKEEADDLAATAAAAKKNLHAAESQFVRDTAALNDAVAARARSYEAVKAARDVAISTQARAVAAGDRADRADREAKVAAQTVSERLLARQPDEVKAGADEYARAYRAREAKERDRRDADRRAVAGYL